MNTIDYAGIRGFNHEPDMGEGYSHEQTLREMGYAKRLNFNSCRLFLGGLRGWRRDPKGFIANLIDFMDVAWEHGISTTPILMYPYQADPHKWPSRDDKDEFGFPVLPDGYQPQNWHIGEDYARAVVTALMGHPGLLFWDIMNEPSYGTYLFTKMSREVEDKRAEPVWAFVRHFCDFVHSLDTIHPLGIGHTLIEDTERSETGDIVDIIIFHDYSDTRAKIDAVCREALRLSKKYGKPVLNNETGCLCRANPYDAALEACQKYHIGWYMFKLMIETTGGVDWSKVHGICYPDGTIRDPSIVAALFGFFRNRNDTTIYPDVNREGCAERALYAAKAALDSRAGVADMLEAAELTANLLEAGELVPMAMPPTARIERYRRETNPNYQEVRAFLYDLSMTLQKTCEMLPGDRINSMHRV
ncbi:MAG: hypothetical protein LBM60_00210 [Clostridium sp.]|jgi:hypothetical protein|nr:hypothetical protein [Clostridium sp.]